MDDIALSRRDMLRLGSLGAGILAGAAYTRDDGGGAPLPVLGESEPAERVNLPNPIPAGSVATIYGNEIAVMRSALTINGELRLNGELRV